MADRFDHTVRSKMGTAWSKALKTTVQEGRAQCLSQLASPVGGGPCAGGPQGKWMENRLEKTDSPISSPEAKKSYLRVKKSRTLALRDLITPRRLTNSRQQPN